MIIKRPQGNRAETPDDLRARLQKTWPERVRAHLSLDADDAWPLEVNIGRPALTGDALLQNAVAIREWIASWRAVEQHHDITFQEQTRRRGGRICMPERIIFNTLDDLAAYLGKTNQEALARARARFSDLKVIDPRLLGLAPHWRAVVDMNEVEHKGACDFINQRQYDPEELLSIREMMISGLDGKFLEKRHNILEEALAQIGALLEGKDYRERLGFRADDRQTLWVKTHPADQAGPFGTQQFALRPSQITNLPDSIHQVTIVENIETFFGYDPKPGVCLFFGSGNAISGMAAEMPFLQNMTVTYWGDLDSFGMKILSRLRRCVPNARSVMMDAETMTGIARGAWRSEPESDRYTGEIFHLTDAEQGALDLIRSGNKRIEQEHLRPGADDLSTLGIRRAKA